MQTPAAKKASLLVFIDANVYLSFYYYTKDEIANIRRIKGLIKGDAIRFYVNKQLWNEISRNRDKKILDAIKQLDNAQLAPSLPRMMIDLEVAEEFQKACERSKSLRNTMIAEAKQKASEFAFDADKVVNEIFEVAEKVEISDGILENAQQRRRLGNPPGKGDFLGDQVHWECLLSACPNGADLHLVTKDADFRSDLDTQRRNSFLSSEWQQRKNSEIRLHEEIGPFLQTLDENIQLVTEKIKAPLVNPLEYSGSFSSTRAAIAKLLPYVDLLNFEELNRIGRAALHNAQVGMIVGDADVNECYTEVLEKKYRNNMDEEVVTKLAAMV